MLDNVLDILGRRRLLIALVGYLVGLIFLGVFLFAGNLHLLISSLTPVSETAALAVASLLAIPVALPFLWERITKVKVGALEFDLSEIQAKVGESLTEEIKDIKRLEMGSSAIEDLTEKLAIAIKEAGVSGVIEIDIGSGETWWSTRLFLLAALADDFTNIKRLVFLKKTNTVSRSYIGMATPRTTRLSLMAACEYDLEETYQRAVDMPAQIKVRAIEDRVALIAERYVREINDNEGEESVKDFITTKYVQKYINLDEGTAWIGKGATVEMLSNIVRNNIAFAPLVNNIGQLNMIIDRRILVDKIAKRYFE